MRLFLQISLLRAMNIISFLCNFQKDFTYLWAISVSSLPYLFYTNGRYTVYIVLYFASFP